MSGKEALDRLPVELKPAAVSVEGIPAWKPGRVVAAVEALAALGARPVFLQAWIASSRPVGNEFTYTHVVSLTSEEARIYECRLPPGPEATSAAVEWLKQCQAPQEVFPPWVDRLLFAVWLEDGGAAD